MSDSGSTRWWLAVVVIVSIVAAAGVGWLVGQVTDSSDDAVVDSTATAGEGGSVTTVITDSGNGAVAPRALRNRIIRDWAASSNGFAEINDVEYGAVRVSKTDDAWATVAWSFTNIGDESAARVTLMHEEGGTWTRVSGGSPIGCDASPSVPSAVRADLDLPPCS
jgi:hypothetical protein